MQPQTTIRMTDKRKRRMLLISLMPLVAFTAAFIYQFIAIGTVDFFMGMRSHAISTEIANHYIPIAILLGLSFLLSIGVLIYFIVFLIRVQRYSRGRKIIYALLMATFMPVSFPVFWYFVVREAPEKMRAQVGIG